MIAKVTSSAVVYRISLIYRAKIIDHPDCQDILLDIGAPVSFPIQGCR